MGVKYDMEAGFLSVLCRCKGTVFPAVIFYLIPPTIWGLIVSAIEQWAPGSFPSLTASYSVLSSSGLFFLLVFITNVSYNRWWSIRGFCRNLQVAPSIALTLKTSYVDEKCAADAARLVRLACACQALVYNSVKQRVNRATMDELVHQGMLSQSEAELMLARGANAQQMCFHWMVEVLSQLVHKGGLTCIPAITYVQTKIEEARSAASQIKMYMDTPILLHYINTTAWFISFYALVLPIVLCTALPWIGVVIALLPLFGLFALWETAAELSNMFGEDDEDFDTDAFVSSANKNAEVAMDDHYSLKHTFDVEYSKSGAVSVPPVSDVSEEFKDDPAVSERVGLLGKSRTD